LAKGSTAIDGFSGKASGGFVDVSKQLGHRAVVGGIDQLTAKAALGDQPCMGKLRQMKRQRGRLHAGPFGNHAGPQSFRSTGHQQAEQLETRFLSQRAERSDRAFLLHRILFDLSPIVEMGLVR